MHKIVTIASILALLATPAIAKTAAELADDLGLDPTALPAEADHDPIIMNALQAPNASCVTTVLWKCKKGPQATQQPMADPFHGIPVKMGPRKGVKGVSDTPATSANWSGYASVTPPNFMSLFRGTITVPNFVPGTDSGFSATSVWVGEDGLNNGYVEQLGSFSYSIDGTVQQPLVWVENFPNPAIFVATVNVGDQLALSAAIQPNATKYFLVDQTTGQILINGVLSGPANAPNSHPGASFECIWEAPSINGSEVPYGHVGTTFASCLGIAGIGITTEPSTSQYQITMKQNGVTTSTPVSASGENYEMQSY